MQKPRGSHGANQRTPAGAKKRKQYAGLIEKHKLMSDQIELLRELDAAWAKGIKNLVTMSGRTEAEISKEMQHSRMDIEQELSRREFTWDGFMHVGQMLKEAFEIASNRYRQK